MSIEELKKKLYGWKEYLMSEDLENKKTAVVTGAGRGIGKSIAESLARDGIEVYCVSKTESSCGAAAEEIRANGGKRPMLYPSMFLQAKKSEQPATSF